MLFILIISLSYALLNNGYDNLDINSAIFYFYAGVITYQFITNLRPRIGASAGAVGIILFFLLKIFIQNSKLQNFFVNIVNHNFFVVVFYISLLILLVSCELKLKKYLTKYIPLTSWIGNLTYSTYLIHVPFQIAILVLFQYLKFDLPATAQNIWFLGFYLVAVILLSRFCYKYFEIPTRIFIRNKI